MAAFCSASHESTYLSGCRFEPEPGTLQLGSCTASTVSEVGYDVARRTAEQCFMPLTVGGGVRSRDDVRDLLLAGADKVSFNSAAVANPDVVAEAADQFGSQCIVVAIDAKTVEPGRWEIFTHGGRRPTGIDAVEFARTVTAKVTALRKRPFTLSYMTHLWGAGKEPTACTWAVSRRSSQVREPRISRTGACSPEASSMLSVRCSRPAMAGRVMESTP